MSNPELQHLLFKQIYEALPEGILVVDQNNIIQSHNHQFLEIWQIPAHLLQGQEAGTAIGLDHKKVFSTTIELVKDKQAFLDRVRALNEDPDLKDHCEIQLLDGRTLERHSTALKNSDGQYMGRAWFFRDISERKNMEKGLKLAQFSVEWAQDAIFRIDEYAKIQYVNDSACKHLGYTREELLKLSVPDINPGFSFESWSAHWKDVTRLGWRQFETVHKRKDGTLIPVEVVANFIQREGELIFFSFVRNISERKLNEANALAAKQAEESNRLRSIFLAGISHELRTPLNAILGFAQLLNMDKDSCTQEQQESVSHILIAGKHLLCLINDLLDFSQIDIGKLHVNIEPLGIAEMTSICVSQIASAMVSRRDIVIENTITDTALCVKGDSMRLRQVLINLLSNAVKYNKEKGHVRISCRVERAGWLRIEVEDTGVGIASEKLSLLYAPFERIDQKHGTISGVGIGLHISKLLVEAMQGTVGAESVKEQGSKFWFELPLADEGSKSAATFATEIPPLQRGLSKFEVLYIEDNPVNAELVRKALKKYPAIEVLISSTAEEGMKLAEVNHPNLILMDIHLPGMDGITATGLLKSNHMTRDIPVVALSADVYKTDIERALSCGCSAYLTKPIELKALYEMIDSMRIAKQIH